MEPVSRLRPLSAHQISLRRELIADGWRDADIRRGLRGGALVRLRWGAYLINEPHARWTTQDQTRLRARAVVRSAATPVVLSHTSALLEYDVEHWDLPLDDIHLTRPDMRAGRREAGVVQHRGRLGRDEIVSVEGLLITAAARTAVDVTRLVDTERSVVLLDAMLRSGLTTHDELWQSYAATEGWAESAASRMALMLADARAGSVGESRLRYLCWKYGLPAPELQYEVRDQYGVLVGVVDFAWPELGVFCEFDGKEKYVKHARPGESPADAVFREKVREDRIREVTGFSFVRLTWSDLYRPAATAARIRWVLSQGARNRTAS